MNQPAQSRLMPNFKEGTRSSGPGVALHPAWRGFIDYCAHLGYGEIATLKIQDGLPRFKQSGGSLAAAINVAISFWSPVKSHESPLTLIRTYRVKRA